MPPFGTFETCRQALRMSVDGVERKSSAKGQGDANDPFYGPAARCKSFSSSWRQRSCINVSGL
jgi:hypothetical protein